MKSGGEYPRHVLAQRAVDGDEDDGKGRELRDETATHSIKDFSGEMRASGR